MHYNSKTVTTVHAVAVVYLLKCKSFEERESPILLFAVLVAGSGSGGSDCPQQHEGEHSAGQPVESGNLPDHVSLPMKQSDSFLAKDACALLHFARSNKVRMDTTSPNENVIMHGALRGLSLGFILG